MIATTPRRRQPAELLDRGPPRDADAERAVLACLLVAPDRMPDVAAALEASDYTGDPERTIYGAMLRLHQRGVPVDMTLLCGELRDADEYDRDRGPCAYTLLQLLRLMPLVAHLPHYIARVREVARRRHAMERGIALIQAAHGGSTSPHHVSATARRKVVA